MVEMVNFYEAKFDNVDEDAIVYIFDPPSGWANFADCVEFPCTGPENVVIKFFDTTYEGDT
jgi:hypothetical protein